MTDCFSSFITCLGFGYQKMGVVFWIISTSLAFKMTLQLYRNDLFLQVYFKMYLFTLRVDFALASSAELLVLQVCTKLHFTIVVLYKLKSYNQTTKNNGDNLLGLNKRNTFFLNLFSRALSILFTLIHFYKSWWSDIIRCIMSHYLISLLNTNHNLVLA